MISPLFDEGPAAHVHCPPALVEDVDDAALLVDDAEVAADELEEVAELAVALDAEVSLLLVVPADEEVDEPPTALEELDVALEPPAPLVVDAAWADVPCDAEACDEEAPVPLMELEPHAARAIPGAASASRRSAERALIAS